MMGAWFSDEPLRPGASYLSSCSVGSASTVEEIEEEISVLTSRLAGIQKLLAESKELCPGEAEDDNSVAAANSSQQRELASTISVLEGDISRLKVAKIDCEARAILLGNRDAKRRSGKA